MALLSRADVRVQNGGLILADDLFPPGQPFKSVRLTDFGLWGWWIEATVDGSAYRKYVELLVSFKPWLEVQEVTE